VLDAVKNFGRPDAGGDLPIKMGRPQGDSSGLISSAKEGLSRSNKLEIPRELPAELDKKTESDMQWERIQRRLKRQLKIKVKERNFDSDSDGLLLTHEYGHCN
jgi:hypothetical protein